MHNPIRHHRRVGSPPASGPLRSRRRASGPPPVLPPPPAPSLAAATLPSAGFWGFVCPVRLSLLVLYPHMSEIPGF